MEKSAKYELSPEEVNDLMKDWFVRDGETFTKISAEHRIGWEPTDGSSYSVFLTEDRKLSVEDLFRHAYELGYNMLLAMNIPGKVHLLLDKKQSATDGRAVWLSTEVFDEIDYSVGEKLDVFLGLAVHEGAHLLYTDMPMYQDIKKKVIQSLANVYEDERIEMRIGEDLPGFVRYLEKVKYYYFDKYYIDSDKSMEEAEMTMEIAFSRAFSTLLKIIRFPRYLRAEDVEFFGAYLIRIKDACTPYPTDTAGIIELAETTYLILKEFIKDTLDEVPKDFDKMFDDIATEATEAFDALSSRASEMGKKGVVPSDKLGKDLPEILDGALEKSGSTYTTKAKTDKSTYDKDYREILPYVAAMRRALSYNDKDYKIVNKGMRNGYLDTNKLVEAKAGVQTVYESYGRVLTDKVAICFLIDQSGSMGGDRIDSARKTAVLMYEALKSNRSIQLFIYGHTADTRTGDSTELHTYVEPGYAPKYALGSVRAICENRDGEAILQTAKRVRAKSSRKCLMFILSDGAPAASGYGGAMGISDTKRKVLQVERMGFDVVQIAINHSYDPKTMFKKYIVLDELSSLAKDLNKFVKKSLLKNQKISIT